MKTKLLFALLLASQLTSAQIYISELVASPPNNSSGLFNDYTDTPLVQDFEYAVDDCLEYFEFRGTPNTTIGDDVYFIVVDGDSDTPGLVREEIDLSGLSFGSNGVLSIVANMTMDTGSLDSDGTTDISGVTITNPYATELAASSANVVTISLTGTPAWVDEGGGHFELDKFNSVSQSPDIGYDGTINDQSSTYMVVDYNSAITTKGDDLDADDNGILDPGTVGAWTIHDSVSILDDDDGNSGEERAYGSVIFVEKLTAAQISYNGTATVVTLNDYPQYIARQGASTGYACTADGNDVNDDWMAGRVNSRSWPDWRFSGTATNNFPTAQLTSSNLSDPSGSTTYGDVNIDFGVLLSTNDISASNFSIYPSPANKYVNIKSKNTKVSSVEIYNLLGSKVKSVFQLNDDRVNVENLSKGMYLLKINADANSITKKIVIE